MNLLNVAPDHGSFSHIIYFLMLMNSAYLFVFCGNINSFAPDAFNSNIRAIV